MAVRCNCLFAAWHSIGKCFLHEVAREADRMICKLTKTTIAEPLVKPTRLELVRVQPHAAAPTLHRFALSTRHELSANAISAQRLGNKKNLDEQPAKRRPPPQTSDDLPILVMNRQNKRPMIVRARALRVECKQRTDYRFAGGRVGFVGQPNRYAHGIDAL